MWLRTYGGDLLNLDQYARLELTIPHGRTAIVRAVDPVGHGVIVAELPPDMADELMQELTDRVLHAAEVSKDGVLTVRTSR